MTRSPVLRIFVALSLAFTACVAVAQAHITTVGLRSFAPATAKLDLYNPSQLAKLDSFALSAADAARINETMGFRPASTTHIAAVLPATLPLDENQEMTLGREIAGRALGTMRLIDDAALQLYVNRVGRWLASHSERPNLPWRFGVVVDETINAYSAPGGYVLITRGLYDALDDEAQLAVVLAHAIASITEGHHVNTVRKAAAISAMGAAAESFIDGRAERSPLIRRATAMGHEVFARRIEKDAILQADAAGIVLCARAGYDAAAIVRVLKRLPVAPPTAGGSQLPAAALATHPEPAERIAKVSEKLPELQGGRVPPVYPVTPR